MGDSADAGSVDSGVSEANEAADLADDSPSESDISDLGHETEESTDAASAEESEASASDESDEEPATKKPPPKDAKPKQPPPKKDAKKPDDGEFEVVAGYRVHKSEAKKFKALVQGAFKAFEEGGKTKKLIEAAKTDPAAREQLLKQIGLDGDKFAAERLSKKFEEQLETPEQKQQRERDDELTRLKAENEQFKKDTQERELRDLEERAAQQIDREWTDALSKAGLPVRTERLKLLHLRRMAELSKDYLARNVDPPVEHLIDIIKEERAAGESEHLRANLEESSDEEFDAQMRRMSAKARNRIRGWFIAQARNPQRPNHTPAREQPAAPPRAPKRSAMITPDELHEHLGLT